MGLYGARWLRGRGVSNDEKIAKGTGGKFHIKEEGQRTIVPWSVPGGKQNTNNPINLASKISLEEGFLG